MAEKYTIKIAIVGIGMVGAPLKRYFEEFGGFLRGENLFLYDIDPGKEYSDDINQADVIFISVPTPRSTNGACDISEVDKTLVRLPAGKIAVIKSTVPPGTTVLFQKKYPHLKILFNPEFLTERTAWEDTLRPDKQIVGFTDQSMDVAELVLSLLPKAPFMSPSGKHTYERVRLTASDAEMVKYGTNVYYARKVNFANIVAAITEKVGAHYENVRMGLAADFRIGDSHLDVNHGGYRGFGGYCLPKDLDALIAHVDALGLADCKALLTADRKFNEDLLGSQGLTLAEVSTHSDLLEQKLKSRKEK